MEHFCTAFLNFSELLHTLVFQDLQAIIRHDLFVEKREITKNNYEIKVPISKYFSPIFLKAGRPIYLEKI